MSKFRCVQVACVSCALIAGCQQRRLGVIESVAEDGMAVRIEVRGQPQPIVAADEVDRLVEAYTARRSEATVTAAASSPSFAERALEGRDDRSPSAFDPFVERGCPPQGNAQRRSTKSRNRLKNRIRIPEWDEINDEVTLAWLREPGDDRDRWSSGMAATIEGYVKKAFATGAETCNCQATVRRYTDRTIDVSPAVVRRETPFGVGPSASSDEDSKLLLGKVTR